MVIISNYEQSVDGKGEICIKSNEQRICPICSGWLSVIGSRGRVVIDPQGEKKTYRIRRLRCKGCGRIHHELADMMIPYKRHSVQTIESY